MMASPRIGFVSVVAPMSNAASYIAGFVTECREVLSRLGSDSELILVDDASTDASAAVVSGLLCGAPNLRLVRLSRRFGPDVAMVAGLDTAIGDVVVLMRPECDPPAELPAMVAKVAAGAGVVTGVDIRQLRPEGYAAALLRRAFHTYTDAVLRLQYPPHGTTFQALSRAAATAASRSRMKRPTFPLLASQIGFGGELHGYTPERRPGAPSPDKLFTKIDRGLSVLSNATLAPLRGVAYLGLLTSAGNVVYLGILLGTGGSALAVQVTLALVVGFAMLAGLCEGVGRTLVEVLDRPLYHVAEERNGSALLPFADRHNVEDAA